jgi:RNA polymerase sigma factor (sigma-70 family)
VTLPGEVSASVWGKSPVKLSNRGLPSDKKLRKIRMLARAGPASVFHQGMRLAAVPSTGRADQVDRLAASEADATRALYETYANQIFGYCLHQLGSREEAEDAVQSTFLNAFRGLKRGVVPEMEAAWLFKIAHNVCLSRRRSSWRRGRIESPADFDVVEEMAPAPSRRSDELIGLQDVLETMPENQRRAILLREWQGLSYHEIADELGLSQSAVETLIFRARRSLASGLEQPPETARKRMRARAGDFGNLLAGIKSMLLGSAAAVKVAATVAVISATTVVAAAPVQSHVHHAAPATPSSSTPSTSSGSAGSGLVQPPTPVFQAETTTVAAHGRGGAGHASLGLPATTSFGLPAVADGTTTSTDDQTATAPSTPASSDPAPTGQPSQPTEQPSQPAPQQSTPPPASNTATTGNTSGQATPVSTPLSQTATPGLSSTNGSDPSGTQSGTGQSGTGSTGDASSSGQTTTAPPTTTKNLPVPPIPVPVPVTTSPTPASPVTTNPVTTSPPTSTSGTTQTTGIVVTGGPLSQRVSPGLTTTSGGGTSSGTSSSSSSSGTPASTPPALPVPPVSVNAPVTTTTSGSGTGKPKVAPVKSANP